MGNNRNFAECVDEHGQEKMQEVFPVGASFLIIVRLLVQDYPI